MTKPTPQPGLMQITPGMLQHQEPRTVYASIHLDETLKERFAHCTSSKHLKKKLEKNYKNSYFELKI